MENTIIKELEINPTNVAKIATNSKRCYIIGIGWTDYTIHREAKDLKHYYGGAGGFFKDFSINLMNRYHVTTHIMRTLVDETKFREQVTLNGKKYKVEDAYYGLHNRIRLSLPKPSPRSYPMLQWEGENLNELQDKIKIVLHLKEIE